MSRYLDPTNDVAFKKIFRQKEKLLDLLNSFLQSKLGRKLVSIEFLPTEEIPDIGQGKRSIFDLKVKDEAGKIYVIEMQNRSERHYINRVQRYAAHTLVSQLPSGGNYAEMMPIIVVSIMKEKLFGDDIPCVSYHINVESSTGQSHLFLLSYLFIELPKFTKAAEELAGSEDEWLYFFSKWSDTKEIPSTIKDNYVVSAYSDIEQFNWSKEQYDAYFRAMLLAEAENESLKKSYTEGKVEGKLEGKVEVASAMLSEGQPTALIAKVTGLSELEIASLKARIENH